MTTRPFLLAAAILPFTLAACGGGSSGHQAGGRAPSTSTLRAPHRSGGAASTAPSSGGSSPGALSPEGQSAATGDIPDNQVFLTFHDSGAGYSMKYPEGWTQRGGGREVTFQDKSNIVHIVVLTGPGGPAAVPADIARLKASRPGVHAGSQHALRLPAGRAVKLTYTTRSSANPVTGKRVTLVVDRYEIFRRDRRAVIDLGTPRGVDNVDAYRMMIESFRWR